MQMIEWMSRFLETDNTKLIYILVLILSANIIDFAIGWINAKLNKKVKFSSSKAIYGIARKMVLFILAVYFIPVALLMPEPVGIGALYTLYTGYLISELNSILNHLKIVDDDKNVDMFADFIKNLTKKDKGDK